VRIKRRNSVADICKNRISVVGLKESPEKFLKKLSKVMFDIDLDDRIPADKCASLGVLVADTSFVKCGVAVPRFYVQTKWQPAYEEVRKASQAFPDLLFHVYYQISYDGPFGEFVVRGGRLLEHTESGPSWYLFDELRYPSMSLLPKYMDLTLAQRGAAAIDDAIEMVKRVNDVIQSNRFTNSPYHALRDKLKLEETTQTLVRLLCQMEQAAELLTFEGVLLPKEALDAGHDLIFNHKPDA
jgi:hypothetical protein